MKKFLTSLLIIYLQILPIFAQTINGEVSFDWISKSQMERDKNIEMIKNTKKLNKLSKITAYMKENYNGDISLESLAKTFGYSSTYLSRMFQKYAKMNYKAYLDNLRLECAYKALVNTDLSISTIASDNGFPNSKAFTKMFRKKYDKLPSEFRKELSK